MGESSYLKGTFPKPYKLISIGTNYKFCPHNPKVGGSNPSSATKLNSAFSSLTQLDSKSGAIVLKLTLLTLLYAMLYDWEISSQKLSLSPLSFP